MSDLAIIHIKFSRADPVRRVSKLDGRKESRGKKKFCAECFFSLFTIFASFFRSSVLSVSSFSIILRICRVQTLASFFSQVCDPALERFSLARPFDDEDWIVVFELFCPTSTTAFRAEKEIRSVFEHNFFERRWKTLRCEGRRGDLQADIFHIEAGCVPWGKTKICDVCDFFFGSI